MQSTIVKMALVTLIVLLLAGTAHYGNLDRTVRTFDRKDVVKINTVSGDCIVEKGEGDKITVEVINSYRPRDSFEPKFRERSRSLKLTERFFDSNSGSATWTLTVPEGTDIEFSSASGNLTISDLHGAFSATTASGDIELRNCAGEYEISSASGDVDLADCRGEFKVSTASGDIDAAAVTLDEESSFSTASGKAQVQLKTSPDYDLQVSSASGRAELDLDGNRMNGTVEMVAKAHGGRISAPVKCDREETFHRWGDTYIRQVFNLGRSGPEVSIHTASGRAVWNES